MDAPKEVGYCLLPTWIMKADELSSSQKLIMGRIISLSMNPRGYCFASNGWFAKEVGVSERTVRRSLSELEELGYIEIEDRKGGDSLRKVRPKLTLQDDPDNLSGEGGHDDHAGGGQGGHQSSRGVVSSRVYKQTNGKDGQFDEEIEEVFEFWKSKRARAIGKDGGPEMKLTGKRESKIRARLKEGYTVNMLKEAVIGLLSSKYHRENGFLDIELICRDQSHVEKYRAWFKKGGRDESTSRQPPKERSNPSRLRKTEVDLKEFVG